MGNILCRLSCTEDQPEVESSERVPRRRKPCNPRRWFRKHVLSRRVAPKPLEETLDEVIEVCHQNADEPVVDNVTATSADVEHSDDEDSAQDVESIDNESQSLSDEPCTTSEEEDISEDEDSAQDVENIDNESQSLCDEPCTTSEEVDISEVEDSAQDVENIDNESQSLCDEPCTTSEEVDISEVEDSAQDVENIDNESQSLCDEPCTTSEEVDISEVEDSAQDVENIDNESQSLSDEPCTTSEEEDISEDEDSAQDVELELQAASDEPCTSHGQSHAMFEETAPCVDLLSLESFSDSDWDMDEDTTKKPKRNLEEVQAALLENAKVIQDLHARGPQVYACSYRSTPAKCNDEEDEEMQYELTRSFSMPAALNLPERYQAFPSRTTGSNHLHAVSSFNAPFYVPRPIGVVGVKPSAPHVNARLSIACLPESEDGVSTPRRVQKDTNATSADVENSEDEDSAQDVENIDNESQSLSDEPCTTSEEEDISEDEDSAQDVDLEPQTGSDEPCTSHGQSHAMFEETAPCVDLLSLESFSDSDWDKDEETTKKPKRNIEEVQAVLLENAKVIQDLHAREFRGPQVYACSYKSTPAKCNDEEDEEMQYELTRSFSMPAALNLPERYQAFPSRTTGSNQLQAVSSFNAPFYVPRPVEVLGVKPSAPHVNARLSIACLPESEDGLSTPRRVQKDIKGTNCEQPWHTKPSVFMTRSAVSQDKSFTECFRTPDQAISVGAVEPWSREPQPNNAESPQDDEYPSTSYGGTR